MIEITNLPQKRLVHLLMEDCAAILNEYTELPGCREIPNGLLLDHLEDTINQIIDPGYESKF